MIMPMTTPPSAPGVTQANALSGENSSALASVLAASAAATRPSASASLGARRRVRQSRVSTAPVKPQAVMMVSDSQYCSALSSASGRSSAPRSTWVDHSSESQSETMGSSCPCPNR